MSMNREPENRRNKLSDEVEKKENGISKDLTNKINNEWFFRKYKIRYVEAAVQVLLVGFALYGFFTFPYISNYKTALWALFMQQFTQFGISGGAHRLWSHRSYKAKLPVRIFFATGYLSAALFPLGKWILIHRVHHKYTDTDADPHNIKNGFFFAHSGWSMIDRPNIVKEKYKNIDMTDIKADSVVKYADKYFVPSALLFTFISVAVPVFFWNESWYYSFLAQVMRHAYILQVMCAVNSFSHMFGDKPFDKNLRPTDNRWVSYLTGGEGWHNYHHVFPYDYRSSELGGWKWDCTGLLIDFFAKMGLAYDLKVPKASVVEMTIRNRGDETLRKALTS